MEQKFVKHFFIQVAVLLIGIAAIVMIFDPFYHYHGTLPGLKAVINKAEYQCIGSLRNFEYDALVLGSSVAENYNNHWFDEAFGCTTIKGIKSAASTTDLLYYLGEAYEEHELRYVFYSLDIFALSADTTQNFVQEGMPLYLYNKNPFDDVKYVFNKDVLFEHIPYMLAVAMQEGYDDGTTYNWAQYKTFSEADALLHYTRPIAPEHTRTPEEYQSIIDENVALIENVIAAHPETEFYIFYPPYSLLWWDTMQREGKFEQSMYAAKRAAEILTAYDHVHMYNFLAEEEIVCNLNLYMDSMHFCEDINHWIVEELAQENNLLTQDNYETEIEQMRILAERILEIDIKKYYPEG